MFTLAQYIYIMFIWKTQRALGAYIYILACSWTGLYVKCVGECRVNISVVVNNKLKIAAHTSHPQYIGAVSEPSCVAEEGSGTRTHSAETDLVSTETPRQRHTTHTHTHVKAAEYFWEFLRRVVQAHLIYEGLHESVFMHHVLKYIPLKRQRDTQITH